MKTTMRNCHRRMFFLFFFWACFLLVVIEIVHIEKLQPFTSKQFRYWSSSEPNHVEEFPNTPWFLSVGNYWPQPNGDRNRSLFPTEGGGNRIVDQLMYIPESYQDTQATEKVILVYNGLRDWEPKPGIESFQKCPVKKCFLTDDKRKEGSADAIIFRDDKALPENQRNSEQIWIMYFLESPYHTPKVNFHDAINWTASYRYDSDIVIPYGLWIYYNSRVRRKSQSVNFAANKTKKVAWFVSNCFDKNGRLKYAKELSKYIQVDIYGECGSLKCPRSKKGCFDMLKRDYKFYLSFENSNCFDYITEKFFFNALHHDVLPIVMGARPEDYKKIAPENSYIHVDEFSNPAELAAYLRHLDENDDLYNAYFQWKGTGEFVQNLAFFWCRLCAMLHSSYPRKHYEDVDFWWRGREYFWSDPEVCTSYSWRNPKSDNVFNVPWKFLGM